MSDLWTDRLSEYLDGELAADERAELESHLRHCVACGAVLADLKRIVARAQGLEDRGPERDLWPAIAARIGAGTRREVRRWSFSLPQLAAAGITLMALSGGAAWLLHPAATPLPLASQPVPAVSTPRQAGQPLDHLRQGDSQAVLAVLGRPRAVAGGYDGAVADLERVLEAGRGRLDTTTVRVIERNLATIDRALAQAQRAVTADSANLYLNSHLAETKRQKLELLRQAAALVSSVS
jgi:anti-sigma factor RsiW